MYTGTPRVYLGITEVNPLVVGFYTPRVVGGLVSSPPVFIGGVEDVSLLLDESGVPTRSCVPGPTLLFFYPLSVVKTQKGKTYTTGQQKSGNIL